jgi:hypothetical protein
MNKSPLKSIVSIAFYISSICGLGYFAAIVFLNVLGLSLSDAVNWVYRISIIIAVIWSVIHFRIKYSNLSYFKAFNLGLLTSFFLGVYMAISIFVFHKFLSPDYNKNFESYYRQKRSEQMYQTQLDKLIDKNGEDYKLTAADTLIVEKGLDLHIKNSHYFFTTEGAVFTTFIFSLVWGFAVSTTVAFMAKKK